MFSRCHLWPLLLALTISFFLLGTAYGQLARVGPVDPNNGFPRWYQDKDGLALDLCLPSTAELANGACVLLAADIPNPDAPIAFPANFPEEAFWFLANAAMDVPGGRATLVLALEAAFANGGVAPGDQVSFARLRILFDAAQAGHYIVTTPYGVREFDVDAPGKRAVFSTEDVGIGAPGDFSGALNGSVGPFLHASATPGGTPSAPFSFSGNQYLADPGATTAVTGSPLGPAFNVFKIEGPVSSDPAVPTPVFQTDQFTLNGKIHTAAIPSPMQVLRATYGRDADGLGHADVFASATAGIGNAHPTLTMSASGITTTPLTENNGKFYGQAVFDAGRPNIVTVTNTADVPASLLNFPVVDEVTIIEAAYDPANSTLRIGASSSDHKSPPKLVYEEQPLTPDSNSPWMGSLTLTGVNVAPPDVTVTSTYTGRSTAPVVVSKGNGQPPAQGTVPVALGDQASATGATPVIIAILANDTPNTGVTVRLLTQPANGTAELLSDSTVRYTARAGFAGDDSFQYVTTLNGVDSNAASVIVTVAAANNGPIARDDSAIAVAGTAQPIRINVLANDTDPDAGDTINAASLTITAPSGGTATTDPVNAPGAIFYTPPAVGPATATLQYTVADNHGALSNPATVTVTVTAQEVIQVAKAEYRASGSEWIVDGTSSIVGPGNRMTIDLIRGGLKVATVGRADVDNLGAWRFRQKGSPVVGRPGDTLRITSSQNTVLNGVVFRIN